MTTERVTVARPPASSGAPPKPAGSGAGGGCVGSGAKVAVGCACAARIGCAAGASEHRRHTPPSDDFTALIEIAEWAGSRDNAAAYIGARDTDARP